jgi:hypothetical protein
VSVRKIRLPPIARIDGMRAASTSRAFNRPCATRISAASNRAWLNPDVTKSAVRSRARSCRATTPLVTNHAGWSRAEQRLAPSLGGRNLERSHVVSSRVANPARSHASRRRLRRHPLATSLRCGAASHDVQTGT